MNNQKLSFSAAPLILLAVFNACFFLIWGTDHPQSVWTAWVFIHLGFAAYILLPKIVHEGSDSSTFSYSLNYITGVYLLIQLVLNIILIVTRPDAWLIALIPNIILAGFYLAFLSVFYRANEQTATSVAQHERENHFVKNCARRIRLLKNKGPSKEANRKIEKAYDVMHASQSSTGANQYFNEALIEDQIFILENAVKLGESNEIATAADKLIELIEDRNSYRPR